MRRLNEFSPLQRKYLLKGFVGGFTGTLLVAALTLEIVRTFSADIVLLKTYLMQSPTLLILIPFIKRLIRNNPIGCYRLKGILSIAGLLGLILVELQGWSKVWYLVDAAVISVVALLMMTHKSYYQSCVIDKNKDFSETCGYVEMFNNITYVTVGLLIVAFPIPTVWILLVALPLECWERWLENECVNVVFDSTPLNGEPSDCSISRS